MFVSLLLVFVSDKLPSLENLSVALLPYPPAMPLTRETDREVKHAEKEREEDEERRRVGLAGRNS